MCAVGVGRYGGVRLLQAHEAASARRDRAAAALELERRERRAQRLVGNGEHGACSSSPAATRRVEIVR